VSDTNKIIFWHRRDLRIRDNRGLFEALKDGHEVQPIFIFDKNILDDLENKKDARVLFIHKELQAIKTVYEDKGGTIKVFYGDPEEIFGRLAKEEEISAVYTNRDYEPYAEIRDKKIAKLLAKRNISFETFKDHVILEKDEVVKDNGRPYTIFTPYMKKYKSTLTDKDLQSYPSEDLLHHLTSAEPTTIISLEEMNFIREGNPHFPEPYVSDDLIDNYHDTRDIPSLEGTSRLSVHLRFGTVSIRVLSRRAQQLNEKWWNELIWRDFYQMIIYHFPESATQSFKSKYEVIPWINDEKHFKAWCEGKTGYPIVDAGMRQLNETGWMHNRVRMVVASFLTKHLLIDWRWGEAYFAEKLIDYELASNVGGWQWAAGCGCDAAPYFRVFNPTSQTQKFDKELKYIRKWVPEYDDPFSYPQPIVEHKWARQRAIDTYKTALSNQ